jgi:hypothetical protein
VVLTASQVANIMCEVWSLSSRSKAREETLKECLHANVSLRQLGSHVHLAQGLRSALDEWTSEDGAGEGGSDRTAEATESVYIEGPETHDRPKNMGGTAAPVSLALLLFRAGKAPGLSAKGFVARGKEPVAVLFAVAANRITDIWVSADIPATTPAFGSKDALVESSVWQAVLQVVKDKIGDEAQFHYNNYVDVQDNLGLGLGSCSVAESWT